MGSEGVLRGLTAQLLSRRISFDAGLHLIEHLLVLPAADSALRRHPQPCCTKCHYDSFHDANERPIKSIRACASINGASRLVRANQIAAINANGVIASTPIAP